MLARPATTSTLARLGSLGLIADNAGTEMGRSLTGYRPHAGAADDYEIVEAVTAADVMHGLDALGDDWYDGVDRQHRLRPDMSIGTGPGSPVRHWVSYQQATPVAMATSFLNDSTVVLLHTAASIQPTAAAVSPPR